MRFVEIVLTALVYAFYTVVIAVSMAPSVWLLASVLPSLLSPTDVAVGAVIRASITMGAAFYLFVVWGAIVQATLVRTLSLGVKAGRYPAHSITTVRWLVYSGIYALSLRTVLPFIPMTPIINLYFRVIGCRMGRNVKLNTWMLNDAYLLTIGDDVVIGGNTDVSCHIYENGHLVLMPITIGRGTLIGAHSYISPGVTVGEGCVVGLHSYVRSGRVIPDGSVITSLAGIDVRTAREIERGHLARVLLGGNR